MASTALTRARGFLSRVFGSGVEKQAGHWLPISGGWLPGNAALNYWQQGHNPIPLDQSAIVAACVAAYAQTIAMCPGAQWRTLPDNGRERVANSALARILKKPNAYQSISDFMLNLTDSLYTEGNAYALALRNNRFEVDSLHLMNSRMSRPQVAPNGEIFYSLGGNLVVNRMIPGEVLEIVPAREVLHIKLNSNPAFPLVGLPPLTYALLDVAASNTLVQQALAYANNQGRPSGVITTDQPLTPEQMTLARARWNEVTQGANAGGTPILANGLKWQQAQPNSRDAQVAELLQVSDQRIATVYRVPPALLGLQSGQGPQGSTESLIQFWLANGLGFALNHIEEGIGRFFQLSGQPDEYLEMDTRALLRSSFKDRIDALARGVQGGIYSPNEARAMEDLPAAEAGDEPRVQQQVVPLSFGAEPPAPPAAPTPAPAPAADAPPETDPTSEDKADAILRAAERYRHAA